MKIALFSDTFEKGLGGLTVYVRWLARKLAERGHQVRVFCWESPHLTQEDHHLCITFPAHDLVAAVRGKAGMAPLRVLQATAKFQPEIIHNHSQFTMGLHALVAAKLLKTPLIHHYHMHLENSLELFPPLFRKTPQLTVELIRTLNRWFFNRAQLVMAPGNAMVKYLQNIGVKLPLQTAPFGLAPSAYRCREPASEPFTVVHAGRLSPEKKVLPLLHGVLEFLRENPDARMLVAGDGPERKRLEELVRLHGKEQRVEFAGWLSRRELQNTLGKGHVFVTLSEMETFGIVILEALACGLPVVGTAAGAVPDLVRHGENGLLLEPGKPEFLVESLKLLKEDKQLRQKLRTGAETTAREYDEDRLLPRIEETYQRLITAHPPGPGRVSELFSRGPAKALREELGELQRLWKK